MEKAKNSSQDNVYMLVPVRIGYEAVESFLQKKLVGENIKVDDKNGEETNYAEVLGLTLEKSLEEDFDITLNVEFRTLTSFYKNKKGSIKLHAAIGFDDENQEVKIIDYKLQGTGKNWLLNQSLQAIANRFMYEKLKQKMNFKIAPPVQEQLEKINRKLKDGLTAAEGILVSGQVSTFKITEIFSGDSHFLIHIKMEAQALVDIQEINL